MREIVSSLHAKRDGAEWSGSDIENFVRGVADGSVTDAQLGAFTMAVFRRGMSRAEQVALTLAMRDSGQVMSWPGLDGPVLDKHSTGGVGDMVSLILGPLLAACGAYVPMISGRGLGHTGGTLDKLESIPGFQVGLDPEALQRQVRQGGVAIVGQTLELAPADRRMYAVRDATSTVASIPLIVASILSKKLAEGLDGLVLDVKTGNGAFMKELPCARELAAQMVEVSAGAGLPCSALVTDMNQPLAWSAGNALEVREVIEFFHGQRHPRLRQVVLALGAAALHQAGSARSELEAMEQLQQAIASGAGAERFARMVVMQGGPTTLLDRPEKWLATAPVCRPVVSRRGGFITGIDTLGLGMVVLRLGGGRRHVADKIDHRVGLSGLRSIGEAVEKGTELAFIHAAGENQWQEAADALEQAIGIGEAPVVAPPTVYGADDEQGEA